MIYVLSSDCGTYNLLVHLSNAYQMYFFRSKSIYCINILLKFDQQKQIYDRWVTSFYVVRFNLHLWGQTFHSIQVASEVPLHDTDRVGWAFSDNRFSNEPRMCADIGQRWTIK